MTVSLDKAFTSVQFLIIGSQKDIKECGSLSSMAFLLDRLKKKSRILNKNKKSECE